jgi:four helix bundle protein
MAYESNFGLDEFELYNQARSFRRLIYGLVKKLPSEEKYALGSQMRRAAISVSNNIAEGHGRWYYQENMRFCRIARGSIEELMDDLNICIDENYFDTQLLEEHKEKSRELLARINSYIAYLRRTKQGSDTAEL